GESPAQPPAAGPDVPEPAPAAPDPVNPAVAQPQTAATAATEGDIAGSGAGQPPGALILPDGSAMALDTDYVIGRDPALESAVVAGQAQPLRIVDAEATVSRVHAGIHVDGRQVYLVDLGSANGTRIRPPGARPEQPLAPHVPVVLESGTDIFVGAQRLRYEVS
ncbi:MAG: FHA domain-containing protein, partial [Actinobacteria bacterium]|nr:FHA domain-containing protein [Actinomycetota bacterium]